MVIQVGRFHIFKNHIAWKVTIHILQKWATLALYNLSQTIKKRSLPTFKSVTTETVGLYDDG